MHIKPVASCAIWLLAFAWLSGITGTAPTAELQIKEEKVTVEGDWLLRVTTGERKTILVLELGSGGKGQLFVFRPTDEEETQGSLTGAGLAYKVEGTGDE